MKRRLSETERYELEASLREFLAQYEAVILAYLYGSYLDNYFSDIDIAVWLNLDKIAPTKSGLEFVLELEVELCEAYRGLQFEVHLLNSAPLSFKYQVFRTGKLIVSKDEDLRSDLIAHTLNSYFDFLPFWQEYLKASLKID